MLFPNLLPPNRKQKIKEKQDFRYFVIISLKWFSIPVVLLIFSILVNLYSWFVKISLKNEIDESSTILVEQDGQIPDVLNKFNKQANTLEAFSLQEIKWSRFLSDLTSKAPAGIYFNSIVLDSERKINLTGFALTREDVLVLEKILAETDYVSELYSPFSNVTKPTNISFKFTFKAFIKSDEVKSRE